MRYFVFLFAILLPAGASATCCRGEASPWYISLGGSLAMLSEDNLEEASGGVSATPGISYDLGYGMHASAGYDITDYVSVELEATHRRNDLDKFMGVSVVPDNDNEYYAQKSTSVMANLYVNFRNERYITPYIGAGIGMVNIQTALKEYDTIIQQIIDATEYEAQRESSWVFGYQLMAGLSFELTDPFIGSRNEFLIGYRFTDTQDAEAKSKIIPGNVLRYNDTTHNIEVGFRFHF
jgi:opacity protein-like surface antigen